MPSPSVELRAVFAQAVDDAQQEELLAWLALVDARVAEICGTSEAMSNGVLRTLTLGLLDFENPGWVELWEQDTSVAEAIDHLRSLDFTFEAFWEAYGEC